MLGRAPDSDAEYAERNKANLVWLQQGFQTAKAGNSRAVMIFQQANIFPADPPTAGSPEKGPNGFTDVTMLQKETFAFGKQSSSSMATVTSSELTSRSPRE